MKTLGFICLATAALLLVKAMALIPMGDAARVFVCFASIALASGTLCIWVSGFQRSSKGDHISHR